MSCGFSIGGGESSCSKAAGHVPATHRLHSPYGDGRWSEMLELGDRLVTVRRIGGWNAEDRCAGCGVGGDHECAHDDAGRVRVPLPHDRNAAACRFHVGPKAHPEGCPACVVYEATRLLNGLSSAETRGLVALAVRGVPSEPSGPVYVHPADATLPGVGADDDRVPIGGRRCVHEEDGCPGGHWLIVRESGESGDRLEPNSHRSHCQGEHPTAATVLEADVLGALRDLPPVTIVTPPHSDKQRPVELEEVAVVVVARLLALGYRRGEG